LLQRTDMVRFGFKFGRGGLVPDPALSFKR